MNKSLVTMTICTALVTGCASVSTSNEPPDTRDCAKNFTTDGSAIGLSGKNFQTSMFFKGITSKTAMDKIARQISLEGQKVTTIDRESGLIAASQGDALSKQGRDSPITAIVDNQQNGVFVTIKTTTGFGMVTTESAVKDYFCRVLDAVRQ